MGSVRPNVLVVILDSLRARNTTLSGYHRETTPFLSEFAESATTYTQARAPGSRSLPSHASIFTGHPPQEHGLHTLSERIRPGATAFARLRDRGYDTGLFTDNPYVADLDTGLAEGFDRVYNNRDIFEAGLSPAAFVEEAGLDYWEFLRAVVQNDAPLKSLWNGIAWTAKWRTGGWFVEQSVFTPGFEYATSFREWRRGQDGPWAACVNLMDTHVPFRPGDEYDQWQTAESCSVRQSAAVTDAAPSEQWKYGLELNAYDGTIRQADAVVEQIVESLASDGVLDDTLVIVTSDHGEAFGERREYDGHTDSGHGNSVEESVLHVPLICKRPGQTTGSRETEPVSLTAVPAEVLSVVDGVDGGFGTSDAVVAGARIDGDDVHVVYESADTGVQKFVVSEAESYTEAIPTPAVSYRSDDGVPERVHRTVDSLADAGVTQTSDAEVDTATQQRLSALGYTE